MKPCEIHAARLAQLEQQPLHGSSPLVRSRLDCMCAMRVAQVFSIFHFGCTAICYAEASHSFGRLVAFSDCPERDGR